VQSYQDREYDERLAPSKREEMTLTYAMIADGGIILAADSQFTYTHKVQGNIVGAYEGTTEKIAYLKNGSAFSIAGNRGLVDTLLAKAETIDDSMPFEQVVFAYSQLFQKEYQKAYGQSRDWNMRVHADFLFCGYLKVNGKAIPQIIKLASGFDFGYNPMTRGFAFTGEERHGGVLYLHHRFYRDGIPLEKAKLLGYCILKEVADLDTSVGGPIEIAIITENEAKPLTDLAKYEQKRQEIISKVGLMLGL
jgi:20S proteasome alpha/beta subunit